VLEKRILKGEYVGMNYYAFKQLYLHEKYGHKSRTFLIYERLSKKEKQEAIRHELVEVERMRGGEKYRQAHREALKAEKP